MAALDWSQCPAVESVPGRVSGAWVFRGTRMPVASVFENLKDGMSIDEIVRLYDGLTREQVQSVLAFAAQSLQVPALTATLLSYWESTASPAEQSTAGPRAAAVWICPRCGGPMMLIERLTAARIRLRSPPVSSTGTR